MIRGATSRHDNVREEPLREAEMTTTIERHRPGYGGAAFLAGSFTVVGVLTIFAAASWTVWAFAMAMRGADDNVTTFAVQASDGAVALVIGFVLCAVGEVLNMVRDIARNSYKL